MEIAIQFRLLILHEIQSSNEHHYYQVNIVVPDQPRAKVEFQWFTKNMRATTKFERSYLMVATTYMIISHILIFLYWWTIQCGNIWLYVLQNIVFFPQLTPGNFLERNREKLKGHLTS